MKRRVRKSTDVPWFNQRIKKKMKQRREVGRREGRSRTWKKLKAAGEDMLARSKESFYEKAVNKMTARNSVAYTAIKTLRGVDTPEPWQPTLMRPGKTAEEVGEEMADFYAKISQEFEPLREDDGDDSEPDHEESPKVTAEDIKDRIDGMILPKSYVTYDLPPSIIKPCSDTLSKILRPVINEIGVNRWWARMWKSEEVTVIPKKSQPENFDQCRNISCTSVFSKQAETYMIDDIRREITLSEDQYGGNKGCGTTHLLCDLTTAIMQDIDQPDSAVSLMAVDFAKAFNRMDHNHCMAALAKKGASRRTRDKVAAFLTGREMRIQQGATLSTPRTTPGGAPQGTKSGNLLFSIATDHIGDALIGTRKTQSEVVFPPSEGLRDLDTSVNVNYFDARSRTGTMRLEDTMDEAREWTRDEIEAVLMIDNDIEAMKKFKYVDDLTVTEKLDLRMGLRTISENKEV